MFVSEVSMCVYMHMYVCMCECPLPILYAMNLSRSMDDLVKCYAMTYCYSNDYLN